MVNLISCDKVGTLWLTLFPVIKWGRNG